MPEPPQTAIIYKFAEYSFTPQQGLLLRRGMRIRLQEQPLRLLELLIQNAGTMVSREVIQKRLWPENTYVEFDNSLRVTISKIRDALGDNATTPIFVETIPRSGYKFIAPVSILHPVSAKIDSLSDSQSTEPLSAVAPSHTPSRWFSKTRVALAATLLLLVMIAGFGVRHFLRLTSRLQKNDVVLLADFENHTGNTIFDDTLNSALRIKLEESPYLTLLSEHAVRSKLNNTAQLTVEQLKPVCQSLHAKAILQGSIAPTTSGYRLGIRAYSCDSGRMLTESDATATVPETALAALGTASDELRSALGEPEDSIRRFDAPMVLATSSSLSALRAFSQGEESRVRGEDFETIKNYKLAIDLDPQFALAYARLGVIYLNSNEPDLAAVNYAKAFQLRDHTTERERLYITSHYYSSVLGDQEKAVEVYELWRQLYPQDLIAPNNLADIYLVLGKNEKALDMAREAMRINPNHAFPRAEFLQAAQRLGRYDEARQVAKDSADRKLDSGMNLHMALFRIAVAEDDAALLKEQLNWAHGKIREAEFFDMQGGADLVTGNLAAAQADFHHAQDLAIKNDMAEHAANIGLDLAQFEADLGLYSLARAEVNHSIKLSPRTLNVLAFSALVLAETGDDAQSKKLASQVEKSAPENTINIKMVLPITRALTAMRKYQSDEALKELNLLAPYDDSRVLESSSIYYRAVALLQAKRGADSASEFQRVIDHRKMCPTSMYISLAHLGLARSRRLMGDIAGARAEYEKFLELWSTSTLPQKRQAENELATLKAS